MKRSVIGAALVLSLVLLGGCSAFQGSEPADFSTRIVQTDDEAIENTTYRMTADVTNEGGETGDYTAEFSVDGETVETEELRLEPSETDFVSFEYTFDDPGKYEVAINSMQKTVTVHADPLPDVKDEMDGVESFETEERKEMNLMVTDQYDQEFGLQTNSTATGAYDLGEEEAYVDWDNKLEYRGVEQMRFEEEWYRNGVRYTKERRQSDSEYEYDVEATTFDDVKPNYKFPLAVVDEEPVSVSDGVAVYEGEIEDFDKLATALEDAGPDADSIKHAEFEVAIDIDTTRVEYVLTTYEVEGVEFGDGIAGDGEVTVGHRYVSFDEPVEISIPDDVSASAG